MKVDLKSLQMHIVESEEFHLRAKGRDAFLADIGGKFLEPIDVHLLIENTGREMFVGRGQVFTTIELTCGRCLEEFEFPVATDLTLAASESFNEEDEEIIVLQDNKIEIMPLVEQAIFSVIPLNPLCSEECKGLCPICGINKNLSVCSCEQKDYDPRWEKLKQLK